jgi:hypothetical protein
MKNHVGVQACMDRFDVQSSLRYSLSAAMAQRRGSDSMCGEARDSLAARGRAGATSGRVPCACALDLGPWTVRIDRRE